MKLDNVQFKLGFGIGGSYTALYFYSLIWASLKVGWIQFKRDPGICFFYLTLIWIRTYKLERGPCESTQKQIDTLGIKWFLLVTAHQAVQDQGKEQHFLQVYSTECMCI